MGKRKKLILSLVVAISIVWLFKQPQVVWALEPANPNAGLETRKVLNYLESLPNRSQNRVVSGQNLSYLISQTAGFYQKYIEDLYLLTGKYVALIGVTYGQEATLAEIRNANRILINHWNSNGLVMVDLLPYNPWTGGDNWDTTCRDLEELVNPTNNNSPCYHQTAHQNWENQLDLFATGLAELQDAGVVVLFRPFPEMNWRDTFWWDMGSVLDDHPNQGARVWREFWKNLFIYYTQDKGLDNLLWVYAPADADPSGWNEPDTVYPGSDYVDITGISLYSNSGIIRGDTYEQMLALGKPFGFTERGPHSIWDGSWDNMSTINTIVNNYPLVTFFRNWHSWTDHKVAIIENRNYNDLLNHPWVITRDEVSWQSMPPSPAPISRPVPTPNL
ncbi:MAG: Mannan endo-1,4-beta-mannosidase, partial [uncultured bacterium]